MTKGELRKARQAARAAGQPLTGELALPNQTPATPVKRAFQPRARAWRNSVASREEQRARYIDCGPGAWDDR